MKTYVFLLLSIITITGCKKDSPEKSSNPDTPLTPAHLVFKITNKPGMSYSATYYDWDDQTHMLEPQTNLGLIEGSLAWPSYVDLVFPDSTNPDWVGWKSYSERRKLVARMIPISGQSPNYTYQEQSLEADDWIKMELFVDGKLYDTKQGQDVQLSYPK